ncbi:MAG: hypothetical protein ACP5IE_00610, partial [Infirmifilum sp.]
HLVESNKGKVINAGNEPIGKYFARGINESEGEVIALLEDDDIYMPTKLVRIYDVFSNDEKLIYFHHNVATIDKNGKPMGKTGNSLSYRRNTIQGKAHD